MPTVTGRSVQVPAAGKDFELITKEFPEPGPGEVRIRVLACGVCHSDSITKYGVFPINYPRVPGHEVIGVVDAVGVCGGRERRRQRLRDSRDGACGCGSGQGIRRTAAARTLVEF